MGFLDYIAKKPAAVATARVSAQTESGAGVFFEEASSGGSAAASALQSQGAQVDEEAFDPFEEANRLYNVSSNDELTFFPGFYGSADINKNVPKSVLQANPGPNYFFKDVEGNPIKDGTEYSFAEGLQFYENLSSGDEGTRAQIQKLLYGAGLLKTLPSVLGTPNDSSSLNAWQDAIRLSSKQRVGVITYLNDLLAQRGGPDAVFGGGSGGGGGGAGPKRPTVQIISDEDAKEVLNNIAKNELGRKLSDSERKVASSIIKAMQDKQASEQNAVIDQSMKGGGTVKSPTNPQATAKNEVEGRFENESKTYDLAQAFANLVGLSGGGS